MIKTYPQQTINLNVPDNVYLIAEVNKMSGEITETYYIDNDGNLLKVGDWSQDKPNPAFLFEICRLTGDTEKMINARWESWKRYK